jgi:signal transduction histidine kinase/streptogramin lyase
LLRYRDGKFQDVIPGLKQAEAEITAMGVGRNGDILFAGLINGLVRYSKGQFLTLVPANEMPQVVISVAETADGKVWMGTKDAGLFYVSDGRVQAMKDRLANRSINFLLPIEDRELWIGTENGVKHWNGTEISQTSASQVLEHLQAVVMTRDRDSNVWVGTSKGLIRLNSRGNLSLEQSDPSTDAVTVLFEDREGNLWVGTSRGIARLRGSAFTTYSISAASPSEDNGPVYVDSEGRTWFAPSAGGLYWLKEGQIGRLTNPELDGVVIYSITGSKSGLWIGRQRGGLTHLRFKDQSFGTDTYTQSEGLAQNTVFAVHQSRDGTVWAGTLNGGLSKFKNGTFKTFTRADDLASNSISSILEGADGTMWFGTPNGLSSLSGTRWRTYSSRDGLPPGDVNCLMEDSMGALWIGTSNGLALFRSGSIQVLRNLPESLQEPIFAIEEDKTGSLWIATLNHILRVGSENLRDGTLVGADLREYGPEDGLQGVEGVKRYKSTAADSLGRIWFSTNRGLSFVDPARIMGSSAPAMVHVEGISADGRAIQIRAPVRIQTPHQRITVSFVGLSLSVPARIRFKYRLDGFDSGWSEPTAAREAVFTNLGPGSYRFHLIASNSDGLWNGPEASSIFEVEPAVWQTWKFRSLCVIVAVLAAVLLYRFRLHQLTRQLDVRFEERFSERTRIARDLHDTLLQSFQGLLLRFQTVSDLLPTRPAEAKQTLDSAIDQAARAITEGRDAVQGLRSSTVVTNDLALAIRTLGDELAAHEANPNSAVFDVQVEGTPKDLHPILRDEVYRIAGEALRNAFRHAQAQRIEVEIHYDERLLRLRVRDDGKGIDPEHLDEAGRPGHFGLRGMRERAKSMGGKLAVWSELDSGTELELTIPASNAYEKPARRGRSWFAEKFSRKVTEMKR